MIALKLAIPNPYKINGVKRSGLVHNALALHVLGISYDGCLAKIHSWITPNKLWQSDHEKTSSGREHLRQKTPTVHPLSWQIVSGFGLLSGSNDPANWQVIQLLGSLPCHDPPSVFPAPQIFSVRQLCGPKRPRKGAAM